MASNTKIILLFALGVFVLLNFQIDSTVCEVTSAEHNSTISKYISAPKQKSDNDDEDDDEEDDDEDYSDTNSNSNISGGKNSNSELPVDDEYLYDFDFESAVILGISPNESRINLTATNETFSSVDLKSAQGCPKPFKGKPWVLYGNPAKCHLAGYKYPCSENMKLYPQKSSQYGYCDCNCEDDLGDTARAPKAFCAGESKHGVKRILVYVKQYDSCQTLFDKGFCPHGSWLVLGDDPKSEPICEPRRCPVSSALDIHKFMFYNYQNRSCHSVGDECDPPVYGHLFKVTSDSWVPVCEPVVITRKVTHIEGNSDCENGLRFSKILQDCIPDINGRSLIG